MCATRRDRIEQDIRRHGDASIREALSMAVACLGLMGSAFVPLRRPGALLALGFLLAPAGDLWILRWLLAPAAGEALSWGWKPWNEMKLVRFFGACTRGLRPQRWR